MEDSNFDFEFLSQYLDLDPQTPSNYSNSSSQSSQFSTSNSMNYNNIGFESFDQGLSNNIKLMSGNGNADVANDISFVMPRGNSPDDLDLSPSRRLVHGPAWTIEWSMNEQAILKHGLDEFATDPVITKYAKIAARLRGKTVRDVAMRCQWMKKREQDRRPKNDGLHRRKSMKDRKLNFSQERLASSSSGAQNQNLQLIQNAQNNTQNLMQNSNQKEQIPIEVWCLIEENNRVLNQIAQNLEKGQMQNGALFSHIGNNMAAILIATNGINGNIRKMPPLPASINGDLFRTIWPNSSSMAQQAQNNLNYLKYRDGRRSS
ncbi:hypothetical protein LUZ60_014886 [Juncus effusus]|nr:hypothetical protein LUZ60_014886 [Juncus effusus]